VLAVTKVCSGGSVPMIFWTRKLFPVPAPPVKKTFFPAFTFEQEEKFTFRVVGTSVWDPDSINQLIWIRIQKGKNDPQKEKKVKTFHVFKCWMLSFEG
jgi:hypothetical protein